LAQICLKHGTKQALIGWLNERSTQPPLQQAGLQGYGAQLYASTTMRFAQVIESMGMVGIIYHRWIQKRRDFLALQAVASVKAGWYQSLSRLTQTMVGSALLGVSCWLLLHNKLNGGAAMLIIGGILGGRALTPLVQLIAQWRSIVGVRLAWKRVDALLSALPPRPVGLSLPSPKGVLQVEDVYAAGPGSQIPILRGISFSLRPGEALAIIGPSASGKTTLARLLIGIWPAASGKVRLDMVDVFAWNKTELGPHIGYLPQAVELFEGTIAENIARFGDLEPDKLHAATAAVGLDGIISQLPLGLNTPVGSDGSMLSGGMRQRVGIARAIYGNPAFVVLDEPNSSLDEAGDTALANAIATMKSRGTTVVVITHRNTLLSVVDKLLVLQAGRIQAFGPVEQVLAEMPQVGGPNPLIENNQSTGSPA
jgi:ATP-binding cassette subfamily C exporter for protease/lipase